MYSRPKNNIETTVSSLSSNTLTVNTGDGVNFPATPFYLTLFSSASSAPDENDEIVLVIDRSGDVLTVIRAQQGTSETAWGTGDKIWLTDTAELWGALQNAILPTIDRTIETDATLFETYSDEFDTDPMVSGSPWAWINQGSGTITHKPDLSSMELYVPFVGGQEHTRGILRNIPDLSGTDDWEVITKIVASKNNPPTSNYGIGIILYESGTGKAITHEFGFESGEVLRAVKWTSIGGSGNVYAGSKAYANYGLTWRGIKARYLKIKINRTSSQYEFYYSIDGEYWILLGTNAFTNHFTTSADKIGISITNMLSEDSYAMFDYFRMIAV